MRNIKITLLFIMITRIGFSQSEMTSQHPKVSHAEQIYFDLIRDLGARKGEKELNVGMGMARMENYTIHSYLVEYEFAPLDRIGLELEVPFAFHTTSNLEKDSQSHCADRIEGIKAASQYSLFVSDNIKHNNND